MVKSKMTFDLNMSFRTDQKEVQSRNARRRKEESKTRANK